MALIKNSNSGTMAREAVVLDLGDLQRQGEAYIASARARADQVLSAAKDERERILAGAADVGRAEGERLGREAGERAGREQGHAEALAESRERLEALQAAWGQALSEFEAQRGELLREAEREVIRLAASMAARVVKRAVELDPSIVVEQTRAALGMLSRPTEVVLRVHPEDRALIEEAMAKLSHQFASAKSVELVADAGLDRGSCVVRARGGAGIGGEIDASIGTQLERIVEVLLPRADSGRG